MKLNKAKTRYIERDDKVKEYMNFILESLNETYNEIPDQFVVSLDLLANMFTIMNKAYEAIEQEGLTKESKYFGKQSSTALSTYLNTQNYVGRLISSFGLTPLSKSHIKKNKEEVNVQELLDRLTA
jgi:phage terminase small subunit